MTKTCKLITFIGTSSYTETTYVFEKELAGKKITTSLIPIAILKAVEDKYQKIIPLIYLTPEAEKHENWQKLKSFLETEKLNDYKVIKYSLEERTTDLIAETLDHIETGDHIILDITHAFRYIPAVTMVILMYLKEAKKVTIDHILYGLYTKDAPESPVKDLTELVELTEWLFAARLFRQYGISKELAQLVKERVADIYKNGTQPQKPKLLSGFSHQLQELSDSLQLGLMLDIRDNLHKFLNNYQGSINFIREIEDFIPELAPLLTDMFKTYAALNVPDDKEFELSEEELEAERELLKFYLNTGNLGAALRLAKEYLINLVLHHKLDSTDPLEFEERRKAADLLSPCESRPYSALQDARNFIAHFGFKKGGIPGFTRIREDLEKLATSRGHVLLTPLGLSKGMLYTLLKILEPDYTIVITSEQAALTIDEIAKKARYEKRRIKTFIVKDPYTGFNEIENLKRRVLNELRDFCVVTVNYTGGTSFLQYVVQTIADSTYPYQKITKIFTIDRRPPEEQNENPYVLGEVVEIKEKQ